MIALLKGRIEAYEDDGVIVDVGGVGYHVTCSSRTLAALPRVGEMGQLFTEMLVSENAIRLVGFATEAERAWFRLLDNVQGVGTRVAIAVLSTLSTGELASAIAFGDKAMIGRSPASGRSSPSASCRSSRTKRRHFRSLIRLWPGSRARPRPRRRAPPPMPFRRSSISAMARPRPAPR